jgi:hypothetical protein
MTIMKRRILMKQLRKRKKKKRKMKMTTRMMVIQIWTTAKTKISCTRKHIINSLKISNYRPLNRIMRATHPCMRPQFPEI